MFAHCCHPLKYLSAPIYLVVADHDVGSLSSTRAKSREESAFLG